MDRCFRRFFLAFSISCVLGGVFPSEAAIPAGRSKTDVSKVLPETYRFHKMPETSYYGGINSIAKDDVGRIWFTGTDALYMFDGQHFRSVHIIEPTPYFRSVNNIPAVGLCVSTSSGLFVYDTASDSFSLRCHGNTDAAETDISGAGWLTINDTLVCIGYNGDLRHYPCDLQDFRPTYNCHVSGSDVYLSSGAQLCRLDVMDGHFEHIGTFTCPDGQGDQSVPIADVIATGNQLYVLSERYGLYSCNKDGSDKTILWGPDSGESPNLLKRLYLDPKDILWIASQAGLVFYDLHSGKTSRKQTDINDPYSLPNESVWSIFEDPDEGVWIGAYGGKLAFMSFNDNDVSVVHKSTTGLTHPLISAFAEDSQGRLWVGSEGGGISCWDISDSRPTLLGQALSPALPSPLIKSLKYQDDKLYVAAFNGGVSIVDVRTGAVRDLRVMDPVSHKPLSIYDFEFDGDRGLWLANPDSDLMYWEKSTGHVSKVSFRDNEGAPIKLRVETLFSGQDGMLWLVTHSGVKVLDPDSMDIVDCHSAGSGFPLGDELRSCCHLKDGRILFGTFGAGVMELTPSGEYRRLTDAEGNGLDGLRVFAIVQAEDGDCWITTDEGLYVYRPESGSIEKSRHGSEGECGAYYLRAAFCSSGGKLIFGGTEGFMTFTPSFLDRNPQKPTAFFTHLSINARECSPAIYGVQGSKSTIRLSHRQSNIDIGFSSNSYLEPSKNEFAYRMTGLSGEWHNLPQGQTHVSFLNLPPGHYRFEVKAANNIGLWGDTVTGLSFTIKPSPMLSPLAYLIYLVFIVLTVLGLWSYMTRRKMLEQQLKLEVEKKLQLEEMNRARNEFFTSISHDLKTPLSLVIDPLKHLEQQIPQDAPYHNLVAMMQKNISRVQRMLTQLLQFRQIETVKRPHNNTPGDLVRFVGSIFSLFEFYAGKKRIETEFLPWVESWNASFDKEMVEKVFTNLFSNAIKYCEDDGYVGVRISPYAQADSSGSSDGVPDTQWLSFTVTNSGSEIPESKFQSIFEPFNNEGKTRQEFESHTGLGLALVRAIVDDLGGNISVSSSDNKVSFTVILPFTPSATDDFAPEAEVNELYDYADAEIDAMISEIAEMEMESGQGSRKTYNILVIEDDAQLRSYMDQRLSKHYNTYTAANGQDGKAKAEKILPDIIITDLLMPGKSGFELCRDLRSEIKTSHIPIIALSAVGENATAKIEALESGANVFLDKPVDMDFLLMQISNIIKNQNRLKELYSKRFVAEPSKIVSTSMDEELIKKAVALVEQNYDNEFYDVEEFVSDMAIGRTKLYQKINDLTGMSIKKFILDIRLKRAGQLLRESEYTVAEISTMTGFANPKYFSVCFKRHFGVSPTDFKQKKDAE